MSTATALGGRTATRAGDRVATFTMVGAEDDPLAPTSVPTHVLDRVFVTDALALSLLATVARWGGPRADRLYSAARLDEWLTLVGLPPLHLPASDAELALLAELRLAIHALVTARLDGAGTARLDGAEPAAAAGPAGAEVPASAVATVNSAAEAKGYTPLLRPDAAGTRDDVRITIAELRASIAQSCIEVLTGPWSERLRRCERDPCAHMFVDRSPRGVRRWCTSESCGNIARSRRHRARLAATPPARA